MVAWGENCDTELRLCVGGSADMSPAEPISSGRGSGIDGPFGDSTLCPQQQQQQQQITMLYNGQICVSVVTQVQAKAILSMARKEIDDTMSKNNHQQQQQPPQQTAARSSPPQAAAPPSVGLSMKRSLQRFLQKRKSRIVAASPYNSTQKKKQEQLLLFSTNSRQPFPCSLDLNSVVN